MDLASHSFCWSLLQPFLCFLYVTFPPNFIALTSPHTLSNPLSLRLCICVRLSLPVITFCSPGLCRLTRYPLPRIFIARWHTRYLRSHTFIYLRILFISTLCPSSNLAVSFWLPVWSAAEPYSTVEKLKAIISLSVDNTCDRIISAGI